MPRNPKEIVGSWIRLLETFSYTFLLCHSFSLTDFSINSFLLCIELLKRIPWQSRHCWLLRRRRRDWCSDYSCSRSGSSFHSHSSNYRKILWARIHSPWRGGGGGVKFNVACVAWRAGTTTLCRSWLYPPFMDYETGLRFTSYLTVYRNLQEHNMESTQ